MPFSTTFRTRAGRLIPAVIAAILLASCSSKAPQAPKGNIPSEATNSSDYYLQQAQQSSDDSKAQWQLLAIRAMLREGKLPQAEDQLNKLPGNLTAETQKEQQLLTAELFIRERKYSQAAKWLSKLTPATLSDAQKIRFYQGSIDSNQDQSPLGLIRNYIALEPLLQGQAHQDNIDDTWLAVVQLSQQSLNNIVINANENVLEGWLDLLNVWQNHKTRPETLKSAIEDWQRRYPNNPAAKNLPNPLKNMQNIQANAAGTIALLLPLNGAAQVYGNAIEQGFMAGQHSNSDASVPASAPTSASANTNAPGNAGVPTPGEPTNGAAAQDTPTAPANYAVKVYDTTTQPLPQLLAQVQREGAALVVGPLLKEQVNTLAGITTPLNILALNQPENLKNAQNLCYFALSPEDEARNAAHHIWSQHKMAPLLLLPAGSLGDRIAQAFTSEWQKQGGNSVMQQSLKPYAELKGAAQSGGGLHLSGVPVVVAHPADSTPVMASQPAPSAGGIDAIYIVTTQEEMTLLKPMIDLSFSGQNKPTIYASSRSNQAGLGPDSRLELEGVQFSDIPLLTGANPALMQQAAAQFHNDYSLMRLYAMGFDASTLAKNFVQMRQVAGFQLPGMTGELTANDSCVIQRKLPWMQFHQGSVIAVNSAAQ
jgi:outer membrane PBP1 activator LpoA protein